MKFFYIESRRNKLKNVSLTKDRVFPKRYIDCYTKTYTTTYRQDYGKKK